MATPRSKAWHGWPVPSAGHGRRAPLRASFATRRWPWSRILDAAAAVLMKYLLKFKTTAEPREATDDTDDTSLSGFIGAPIKLGRVLSADECAAVIRLGQSGKPVNAGLATPVEGYRSG